MSLVQLRERNVIEFLSKRARSRKQMNLALPCALSKRNFDITHKVEDQSKSKEKQPMPEPRI